MTIVRLLFPTLFGKRGIFTRSPLLWVFDPLSFHCYHVFLPCFILLKFLYLPNVVFNNRHFAFVYLLGKLDHSLYGQRNNNRLYMSPDSPDSPMKQTRNLPRPLSNIISVLKIRYLWLKKLGSF